MSSSQLPPSLDKARSNLEARAQLNIAIDSSPFNAKVKAMMKASIDTPAKGEDKYELIWLRILRYFFPEDDFTSGRVSYGLEEVDLGVCITFYVADSYTWKAFWTLFIELKDPKTFTDLNARRDAHEQVRKRATWLNKEYPCDKKAPLRSFKYFYILSIFGWRAKLYRLDRATSRLSPQHPVDDFGRNHDVAPADGWNYNILSQDGHDMLGKVAYEVYQMLEACKTDDYEPPTAPRIVQQFSRIRLPAFPANMPRQVPRRVYDSESSSANEAANASIHSMFDGLRIDESFVPREDGGAQTRSNLQLNK